MTRNFFTPVVIADFDANNAKKATIAHVKNALNTRHLLLLKNQKLSLSQQIDLTTWLGAIEVVWEDKHPESKYVQLLQNTRKEYEPFKSTSRHWHTDRSFMKVASKYTVLQAKEVGTGCGGTEFCDLHRAYQDLDEGCKETLSTLHGVHAFAYKFPELLRKKRYAEDEIQALIATYPPVINPLVRRNSVSKKRSLFLSELCLEKILELSEAESKKTLDVLYAHVLASKYRYVHQWEEGDVLIWDNESLMHRALATPPSVPRVFHRTTTRTEIH